MQIKTDTATYLENPRVLQLPPAGGKYIDDLAGAEVLRFTDERDGRGGSFSNTYSVWPTFNCNASRIWLFEHGGGYHVGNLNPATLERVGALEEVVPARGSYVDYESAFWSRTDPDQAFIAVDTQIWFYRPSRKGYEVVADLSRFFPVGARFNQLYVSRDDNRFAAIVRSGSVGSGDYGIMVYEASSNSIKLNVSMDKINGITMEDTGRYVLLVPTDEAGGQNKQYIYNTDTGAAEILLSDAHGQPDYCIGHNDCGADFVIGGDHWRGAFTVRKMSEPHNVLVAWQYAKTGWIDWHVSMLADNEHWALISTYGGILTGAGPLPDGPFVREIFQLGVKEPFLGQFRRLVHTRANWNQPARNYWATPRATISGDGRLACWTGNNNGASDSRTDLFIARIDPAPLPGSTPQPPLPLPIPTPPPPEPPPVEPPLPPLPPPPTISTPKVVITSPARGAVLSGRVIVTTTVTDEAGIAEAYLIISDLNDLVVAHSTTPLYDLTFDTTKLPEGEHSIYVRAWNRVGKSGDSEKVNVTVKNEIVQPPVEPPIPPPELPPVEPPPTKSCSITAPPSVAIARNNSGVIAVQLNDLTEPVTVNVTGSDGQVTVTPLTWIASATSSQKQFQVRTKNKRQVREIKFSSSCGQAVVKVNVT